MAHDSEELTAWKIHAADRAAELVRDGMIVGLGSGSTAALAVAAIGKRVAGGLSIIGVATSEQTAQQARELGIPLSTLAEHDHIDITIDGADEVDLGTFNLIKGRGGALLREKIVASASDQLIIIVDETKLVERLGAHDPVPLEVVPFGYQATAKNVRRLGANADLRLNAGGKPYLTDGGHYILDCRFGPIEDAVGLQRNLDATVGVVEHGLFLGMTSQVIVGNQQGATFLRRRQ